MRTRTSLAAAVLVATVTTTFIVPASAQDSSQTDNCLSSTTNQDSTDNTSCIAVGLAAGLPLTLLVRAGIGATLNVPGLNSLTRFNTEPQRQIGLLDPRIAAAVDQNKDIINGAVGLLGLGLGAAAAFYLLQNCGFEGGSSTEGSSNPIDSDPKPVDPDPEPVDPAPEPEPEPVITVDDFVLIQGGKQTTIPVAAPGFQCTSSGLPNGPTYNAKTGAFEGTIAKLPTGAFLSTGDGGKTFTVTLTCGEASKEFNLQQHDYIRKPATAVGNFTAFQRLDITEATFTFTDDASFYNGQWPDANPIVNRTVTVTQERGRHLVPRLRRLLHHRV